MELHSIGVRNLRSFPDEKQLIEIKKINILVGKNSCGKSTFSRIFPLLKQSIGVKTTKTPILWNGSILDFGDFSTAVRDNNNDIYFDFLLKDISLERNNRAFSNRSNEDLVKEENAISLAVSISIASGKHKSSSTSAAKGDIQLTNIVELTANNTKLKFQYSTDHSVITNISIEYSGYDYDYDYDLSLDPKSDIDLNIDSKFVKNNNEFIIYQKSQNRPGLIPDFFHFYKKDKNQQKLYHLR